MPNRASFRVEHGPPTWRRDTRRANSPRQLLVGVGRRKMHACKYNSERAKGSTMLANTNNVGEATPFFRMVSGSEGPRAPLAHRCQVRNPPDQSLSKGAGLIMRVLVLVRAQKLVLVLVCAQKPYKYRHF